MSPAPTKVAKLTPARRRELLRLAGAIDGWFYPRQIQATNGEMMALAFAHELDSHSEHGSATCYRRSR